MKRLCFSSPLTHLVYFLLRSLYVLYDQTRALFSPRGQFDDVTSLYSLSLFSSPSQKRTSTRVFFLSVSRRKVSLPLFLRERNEEKFLGLSSSSIALPKTTTQLNSPLSSATILIPQNFFFLFVRAKAPPPQKQNKTNHFYEHV